MHCVLPVRCGYSRWDEQEDFHRASGDSDTMPVCLCVFVSAHTEPGDNNRIRWITAIQPFYTGGHHRGSGLLDSLLTLISPGKMRTNTISSLKLYVCRRVAYTFL